MSNISNDRKNEIISELTDGMYDRQTLLNALGDVKDMLTTLYLEQYRSKDEQKQMELVYDELRSLTQFLK